MLKRMISIVILLMLLTTLALPVAAQETKNTGSITFRMEWKEELLDGGKLSLYRVGDIHENKGDYGFVPIKALETYMLLFEDPGDKELIATLEKLVEAEKLPQIVSPIEKGTVTFKDLEQGLYLVVQHSMDVTKGFEPINSFLISVPQYKDGMYHMNVEGSPKSAPEKETKPTVPTTPTTPKPPQLPQTGQLTWPVPLMVVLGLGVFALGWSLCFSQKKIEE